MKSLIKNSLGAGVAMLLVLGAAAPAQAQYYPYPQSRGGLDVGTIVRGIGTAVAVGAIVDAVQGRGYGNRNYGYGNRNYGYGYGNRDYGYGNGAYGHGNYGYERGGYGNGSYGYGDRGYGYGVQGNADHAVNACASQAQRYGRVSISDVERRGSRSLRVRGVIDAGGYNNGGYDNYAGRSFSCNVRVDGRITDFDFGRSRY